MSTLADVPELIERHSGALPAGWDEAAALALLEDVTSAIQDAAGNDIFQAVDDEVTIAGTWACDLQLPHRPVTAVSSVVVDGTAVPATQYQLQGSTGKLWRTSMPWPLTRRPAGHWGGPHVDVVVVCTHGYTDATVPKWLRGLCLDVASRHMSNPEQLAQESILNYSSTFGGARGVSLTYDERRRLRRRLGVTV